MGPPRPRIRGRFHDAERGLSPVVGVTLMVAITVLLAAVVIVMLTGAADPDVAPTMDSAISLDATNAGTELTTDHSGGQEIDVQLNGETIATIDGSSTGSTLFLPTAPGDEVHLVASEDDSDVLVRETFDAGEAGDFVAYYPFDDGGGSTLSDESMNGNDGTVHDDPQWISDDHGRGLEFDGSGDYVHVDDLNTVNTGDVEEFTVAATFQVDKENSIQQIVEHNAGDEEWHIETFDDDDVRFSVNFSDGANAVTTSGPITAGETHVVVGTYDGESYRFYLDGTQVDSGTYDSEVNMGEMYIGKNDPADTQFLDGRLYEFRLYYSALDDHEVEMLTKAMD